MNEENIFAMPALRPALVDELANETTHSLAEAIRAYLASADLVPRE